MPIYFNSKIPEWYWLSNFFPSPLQLNSLEYPTVEHWFQSQKFSNTDIQEKIRIAPTPATAKKLGKKRDPSFRSDWDLLRDEVMLVGLRAKFHQHPELASRLLATGAESLIEQSPWDSYWGSGRSGNGKNRMGLLLQQVREELS